MKISILGTEYTISKVKYDQDPDFAKSSISGYCDPALKQIVICDMSTHPGYEDYTKESWAITEQDTLRHEIVHAFFNESGLQDCSLQPAGPWAKNEEMIDWIALVGPRIMKAWHEAGALPQKV